MSGGIEVLVILAAGMMAQSRIAQESEKATAACTRAEVADAERRNRLETTRRDFVCQVQAAYVTLNRPEALMPAHAAQIRARCDALLENLSHCANERDLRKTAGSIADVLLNVDHAVRQRQWHDQAQSGLRNAEALQTRVAELKRTVAGLSDSSLDPQGREALCRILDVAERSLAAGNPEAEARVVESAEALLSHQRGIAQARATLEHRRVLAEQAAAELHAIVLGLRADATVVRWHTAAVEELAAQCTVIAHSEEPDALLARAQTRSASLVEEANKAEMKARQRDYITRGIARSLQGMGFVVTPPAEEHPGHPATARLLHAASATGKEIAVSVPIEGSVWYEVNGFPRSTETAVGGATIVACDEAEQVLTEMHALLGEEFEVHAGEVTWQGKDPKRKLRRADALPDSVDRDRQGALHE